MPVEAAAAIAEEVAKSKLDWCWLVPLPESCGEEVDGLVPLSPTTLSRL